MCDRHSFPCRDRRDPQRAHPGDVFSCYVLFYLEVMSISVFFVSSKSEDI